MTTRRSARTGAWTFSTWTTGRSSLDIGILVNTVHAVSLRTLRTVLALAQRPRSGTVHELQAHELRRPDLATSECEQVSLPITQDK